MVKIILIVLGLLCTVPANAGHIIGGEIYYDYLGNNNYKFYVSMYKDCDPSGNWADFDTQLPLVVYTAGVQIRVVQIPFPGSVSVPITYGNPCVTPPPGLCILQAVYTTTINLPPNNNGYTISYQRCCRKPQISNIVSPGDVGFTLTCRVPPPTNGNNVNSSPRFIGYPPGLLCNNDDLVHDQSATDPDGDQLIYSLTNPFRGGSSFNPAPTAVAPPYIPVPWVGGFTPQEPLGPGANIAINPTTGILTASPNLTGLFVVGIRVQEVRNGVVINETLLDFLLQVFACQITLQANLPTQEQLPTFVSYCDGLTVDFVNNSWGTSDYEWDFGVPGITTDVSTSVAPSYTYPAPGIYTVTLVANPSGAPCTDTAQMVVNVNNVLEIEWTSEDSVCFIDNSFDFASTIVGEQTADVVWDFGPNANPATSTLNNVNNVEFTTSGYIPVTVDVSFNVCENSFTDSIFIFAEPVSEMVIPDNVECDGFTVQFGNSSIESYLYNWDFGDPTITTDVSNLEAPIYTYTTPGTYTVTLIAGSSPVCSDTSYTTIEINEELVVDFTSQDSLCVKDNSFDFIGQVSGPLGAIYTWDFGTYANPTTSTNPIELGVNFTATGSLPITLTGTYENCVESAAHSIYIYQEPQINFRIEDGLQCSPFVAQFTDLSFAETPISYQWDFGDGNSSTLQNPTNTYTIPGNYPITLVVMTDAGCIDTLSLTKQDLVVVRPKPISDYTALPLETDICNSLVGFNDNSQLGDTYFYWFDDSIAFSLEQNPNYLFLTDGMHNTYQVVTSEYGCKDTSRLMIYIEPFTVYVPNAFTPNEDVFNREFLPIVYHPAEKWLFQVFNRWGELLFETQDQNEAWSGKAPNGEIAQDGVYVWKITYTSCGPNSPEEVLTGTVTLLR